MSVFVWLLFLTADTKEAYMFCYQYQLHVLPCFCVYCQGFFITKTKTPWP